MKKLILFFSLNCAYLLSVFLFANPLPLKINYNDGEALPITQKAVLDKVYTQTASYGVINAWDFNPLEHESFVKCFEVEEIKSTVICVFNSQKTMNQVLLRTNIYVEDTDGKEYISKKDFYSDKKFNRSGITRTYINEMLGNGGKHYGARGYDLPGQKINMFLTLNDNDSTKPALTDAKTKIYAKQEEDFLSFLKTIKNKFANNYTLITAISNGDYIFTISHEVLHAQYFSDKKFRKNVDSYINSNINTPPLELLSKYLKEWAFASIEEDLVLRNNEMLAFLLATQTYEEALDKGQAPILAALLKIDSSTKNNAVYDKFFNEVYDLWKDFDNNADFKLFSERSKEIIKKYDLPISTSQTDSAFYQYLIKKGTAPVIVK
ncbi:hypothetical protein AAIR98_001587 [Elusimicrobium simillimum]|uniref:hypothetical protein n=1 Tax=Elusimicrobium simillimum TaxID=3143438 RepID=UPI003C6EAAD7